MYYGIKQGARNKEWVTTYIDSFEKAKEILEYLKEKPEETPWLRNVKADLVILEHTEELTQGSKITDGNIKRTQKMIPIDEALEMMDAMEECLWCGRKVLKGQFCPEDEANCEELFQATIAYNDPTRW